MKANKVSKHLQKAIIQNIEYLYLSQISLKVKLKQLLDDVHPLLKVELIMEINYSFLFNIKIFSYLSVECKVFLVNSLKSKVYLPNEWIVCKDGPGEEMFFITNGSVQVINSQYQRKTLRTGDYVGEQSLISGEKHQYSIIAVHQSEIAILTREMSQTLIDKFMEFGAVLTVFAKKRYSEFLANESP